MADITKIVEEGAFKLLIDSTTIGHTEDGVEISFGRDNVKEILTHESGNIPVKVIHGGTKIQLKVRALEIDNDHLTYAFPEATMGGSGTTTISQDVGIVLSDTTHTVVVSDSGGTTNKWTFSNMVASPDDAELLYRLGEKWIINLVFRGLWVNSGNRAVFQPTST